MKPRRKKTPVPDSGNVYDRIFKEIMEDLALPILKRFLHLNLEHREWLPDKQQTVTQREPDFLSRVVDENQKEYILHIEFQSADDATMLRRMQEYHGIILKKYNMPILHVVFYFGDKPPRMATRLEPEKVFIGFELVYFKTQDYEELLKSDQAKETLLAVLADFRGQSAGKVLKEIVNQLRAKSRNEMELKGYFNQLSILSRLRKLQAETKEITRSMPIYFDLSTDTLYNEGKLEGKLEGEIIATVEHHLETLCLMSEKELSYELMQSICHVPDTFLRAFRKAYCLGKAAELLDVVRQLRNISGLEEIKIHVLNALNNFGIPTKVAKTYWQWLIQ